ncbi:F0F1 ATP synthase subunit epsilon [Ralstonia solanacearum]|uniref:ATP synthase epsilon chain n=1 Tax=Ralstonia solanacearum (strain Po82) TaxID=1031711 RepID=F6GAH3_RALS8|nr:F0F1 ATP synthase subunit epsilon [Ralstonia solanacearum]AEG71761.1 ATP synthase epsilon chain (ATP synthase f1 sector epsilon subunit) [Ralstonia solanacearum Po82]AMP71651.1 ATP synthase subunit epsilon [Ralstonia solanacearum]AMP76422.1 ATP synthase subunit epsilon [Ralstonia solanacearum]AYB63064.1 F0F1 ATP synthase subunit epsilon [Ralstonia solanacearum]EUJ12378.1 ATP synthase subunit epsilon [Ralstonia solanacearum P673]
MPLLTVDVVTAEERLYQGTAKFVVVPGTEGELGILPGHEPLLTRLRPGTVRLTLENDDEVILFVAGGFAHVLPQGVILLADTAVRARDLDEAKAQQARKAAEELLQNSRSKIDYARAQAELAEAVAQLAAIERMRRRRR